MAGVAYASRNLVLLLVLGLIPLTETEFVRDQDVISQYATSVFLREQCYQPAVNISSLEELTREFLHSNRLDKSLKVNFVSSDVICEKMSARLSALLQLFANNSTNVIIASVDTELCDMLIKLATLHRKVFITWSCPQSVLPEDSKQPSFIHLSAPLSAAADAAVAVASYFRWKTVAILTTEGEWWSQLAHAVDLSARSEGLLVRHHLLLRSSASSSQLLSTLRPLEKAHCKVIILCLPLNSTLADNLLREINLLRLAKLPTTTLLAVHLFPPFPLLTSIIPLTSTLPIVNRKRFNPVIPTGSNIRNIRSRNKGRHSKKTEKLPKPLNHNGTTISTPTLYDTLTTLYYERISGLNRNNTIPDSLSPLSTVTGKNYTPYTVTIEPSPTPVPNTRIIRSRRFAADVSSDSPLHQRYRFPTNLEEDTKIATLVITTLDPDVKVEERFGESSNNMSFENNWSVWYHLKLGLKILRQLHETKNESETDSEHFYYHRPIRFILLDWYDASDPSARYTEHLNGGGAGKWRPLLQLDTARGGRVNNSKSATTRGAVNKYLFFLTPLIPNLEDWAKIKKQSTNVNDEDLVPCDATLDSNCEDNERQGEQGSLLKNAPHIVVIATCSTLIVFVVVLAAVIARKQLLKRRMSKGPYKILLTPSDFVFPQVADALRVDEGIEKMLCCWLQQLQEFGGPEVDKPDLLKGSMGSLKSHAQLKSAGSTGSLPKNLLVDSKARYNGDLVQLKDIPLQGTFELKNKAMDTLVMLHGLRHENLNVLIGCLTDPARPALVWEWCSRGSLVDVLVQDEIKLDWSFRLSLLTDLVRGMRYLHSTPIRVHGYLTSRNCVIDARWVLKVTDYGMPAFYEAQNIPPPQKTARDLLWTAPELLRNSNLRRIGTQPADVYSFGIIMQEVVVRGEPFCMLSLSPEDIIEKVKKPPPLIRPSVSKGAAPPEAINIMRQCWAEQAEMRPDFNAVHDLFKKLNHGRKVNFVDTMFQMLEKYSNNLEELIRERTEQLDMEKKKTEQLLNRMLPSSVAEKLKLGEPVDPEDFGEVTIYFSDIVGFTTISAFSTPFEVVDLLNDLYTCFDATINAFNVYKVETIGDAYMVVGGLPVRISDHADQIATMALHLLHQSGRFKIRHLPYTPLRLRIGIHTGPCCAGVVGLTMPRYCLFGDTVNTASRMESTGSAWRIHLSQTTKEKLDEVGGYQIEYRGETELKGKGKMPTYWLLGKSGFDKELPSPPPLGLDERYIKRSRPASIAETSDAGGRLSAGSSFNQDNSSGDVSGAPTPPPSYTSLSNVGVKVGPNYSEATPVKSARHFNEQKVVKVCAAIHNEKLPDVREESKSSSAEQESRSESVDDVNVKYQELGKSSTNNQDLYSQRNEVKDHQLSGSELAAALLGISTSQTTTTGAAGTRGNFGRQTPRRIGPTDPDLSSSYNRYRCLSPSEQHLNQIAPNARPNIAAPASSRFLRRQFSLDRGDDLAQSIHPGSSVSTTALDSPASRTSSTGRLFKQNSAGAAHDLERIEEIPLNNGSPRRSQYRPGISAFYRKRCELPAFSKSSMSVSVESLN